MIFSAGPCSVCAGAGDALFVRAVGEGRIFFLCGECGVAWASPPTAGVVDSVDPPSAFAPNGFSIASATDIRGALGHVIKAEYCSDEVRRIEHLSGYCPIHGA